MTSERPEATPPEASDSETSQPAEAGAAESPRGDSPRRSGDSGPSGADAGEAADHGDAQDDGAETELTQAQTALAERTADLQRLQAEFLNYKRRVDRDRDLVRENAVFAVLSPMLDVLDSVDRARAAGELEGGFKSVAEQLERIVTGLGVTRFGEEGDPFDPMLHEALSHVGTDPDVEVVTCKHIAKAGYKIGDRVMRAAQVLVVDPEAPAGDSGTSSDTAPEQPDQTPGDDAGEDSSGDAR